MKRKKIFVLALFISIIVFSGIIIIASTITSSRGELEVTNSNITIESSSALDTSTSSDWVYKKAGDKKLINVTLTNTSVENIHRYYQLSLNKDIDTTLKSAILVYYNGEFINTLSELVSDTKTYIDVPTSMTKAGSLSTDSFTFELHQAASNSIFNSKEISININVFAENIDYENYALVSNDSEFVKVIDDINSGLLDIDNIPTIVLANSITLSSSVTIKEPITIETNGNGITGSITINDDNTDAPNALIRIEGNGSINSITLGDYYDKNGALDLIVEHASNQLKYGLQADSKNPQEIDIIGPYSFYSGITISNSGDASYNAGTLTASKNIEFTKLAALTISNTTKTEIINYKHIGIKSAFGESEVLNHLPNNEKIITNDLFLPTFISSYNASIEWKSSNTSIISNDGKIVKDKCDGEAITLTATIKINNRTYTRVFKFKVTSNNNMVNFQKLVKDISPLIIKKKYSNSDAANTTYYLPIVTEYNTSNTSFGNYDYRKDYESPSADPTFNWTAHEDIGLKSLTYSLYDSKLYYYIGLTDTSPYNGVMLIQDTLSNYAKIKISGEFNNGETCDGIINISISLGSDTELLEKAFNHINNELDDISILGNIIVTRLSGGILNEKGDFSLPSKYDEDYKISYNLSDNTGLSISSEDKENSCYHFAVDPTKFTSVETAVPVQATVTYKKSSGTVSKTKIIYVTLPAALHISDLGNISIFNSLKYQVINALPTNEINNNTGFTTSNGIVSYLGYDYILLRDIVGDIEYINNYSFDGNYLKDTGYKLDGSNGANGVTSITLANSSTNNTSTTDTLAYDFIKLIQWATGDTKVTAASILSEAGKGKISSLNGYTSNGETYLTENELAVIEAFYKACTKDNDGTKWSAIKSKVLETAPGRIYDNATLLETILNCLTTEKGINSGWYENYSNGTYGKIYAKYLEIVNRYATTTSENEEHMSPAQEVYNSKFYYSFTSTAANSTTSGTAAISIPCKYYDANGVLVSGFCNRYPLPTSGDFAYTGSGSNKRHGVYAAEKKFGNSDVDIYANETGNPYDSDKTKYITSAELMVLKAFWLGALAGAQNANTDSSNGVLHTFSIESNTKITNALKADENGILPYPKYTIDDFQCYGQAILNAFDACLTIPTTFTSNGIGLLINSFYDNYNSTGYKVRKYGKADDTTFESVLVSSVPAVTNLDNIEGALSYFSKLTSINIIGKENIAIYLSDYGLSTSFARICLTNKSITSLNMQYVSSNWNDFDITNIKHLNNLTKINISNNLGIKSVYPLLNVNRSKYTSVNFSNIGEVYEYNEFAIDNLASDNCTVHYTDKNGAPASKNKGNPSTLVNLSDIEDLVSEHLYLTNVIYDESNTDICWRIEEGNEINKDEIVQGGELIKISSANEMNKRVSPYFFCEVGCTLNGNTLKPGVLYKILKESDSYSICPINADNNGNIKYEINIVEGVPTTDYSNIQSNDPFLTEYNPALTASGEFNRVSTPLDTEGSSGTIYSQNSSIVAGQTIYELAFNTVSFSFFAKTGNNNNYVINKYYLQALEDFTFTWSIIDNSDPDFDKCKFALVTEVEAELLVKLRTNNFTNMTNNMLQNIPISQIEDSTRNGVDKKITLGSSLPSNLELSDYYIYSVTNHKFLAEYGFSDKPENQFTIRVDKQKINIDELSDNVSSTATLCYTLYCSTKQQYLVQTKISTSGKGKACDVGIVYYKFLSEELLSEKKPSNLGNDYNPLNFSNKSGQQFSYFRAYWLGEDNNYSQFETIQCQDNTPTLSLTTGRTITNTATFKCYYIGNGGDPTYRMYDVGTFLLISKDSSVYGNNAMFCFLTEEQKTLLQSWFNDPYDGITFGEDPEAGKSYYIYCPYTRRFISGGTSESVGEIYRTVTDYKKATKYYLNYQNSETDNSKKVCYINVDDVNHKGKTSGFNAYGGVTNAIFIALWGSDDKVNTTALHNNSANQFIRVTDENIADFTITNEKKSETTEYIAYRVDYTVNKVTAHISERYISKDYKFDKFYYLTEDVTIGGTTYKAGNVIRFVCDAFYGYEYSADIEYYEIVVNYFDQAEPPEMTEDQKQDYINNHRHTLNSFSNATYSYYFIGDNGSISSYDGSIIFTKYDDGTEFKDYYASYKYTTYTDQTGSSHEYEFTRPKWIWTDNSFNEAKSDLYVYNEKGELVLVSEDAGYDSTTTYYTEVIKEANVFSAKFINIKDNLYLKENNSYIKVPDTATYDPATTYYTVGIESIVSSILFGGENSTIIEFYKKDESSNPVEVAIPKFEYYKNSIYKDVDGKKVKVSFDENYNSSIVYYFYLGDDIYTTETPKYQYEDDYISLSLNEETFKLFRNTLYYYDTDGNKNEVTRNDQFDYSYNYYIDAYIVSNFRQEVINNYSEVLYLDNKGTLIDPEETYVSSITYYSNEFIEAEINSVNDFNKLKSVLFADEYGLPLSSNAEYKDGTKYYIKKYEEAKPAPTGSTSMSWNTTKKEITRLVSHAKFATDENFAAYINDYNNAYSGESGTYPIIYKYIGETEDEYVYSLPVVKERYEAVRFGTVNESNFESLRSNLYSDQNGNKLPTDAVFNKDMTYYVKTWDVSSTKEYTSYIKFGGYYINCSNEKLLSWVKDQNGIDSNTAGTMDEILKEANLHFKDSDYNLYYGKYYGYNGFTMKSSSKIYDEDGTSLGGYDRGYIYRIVLNTDNSAFIWQRVTKYTRIAGDKMVSYASTRKDENGNEIKAGQIYFATSTCFSTFYTAGKFYRIVEDDFTKTLNVVQFTDVTIDSCYTLSLDTNFISNKSYYTFTEVTFNANEPITKNTYYEKVNNYYILTSDETFVNGKKYYLRNNVSGSYVNGTLYYESNITDIQSQKIHYISQSDYLGYAGTYEIVISAVVRTTNQDGTYSYAETGKKYKIKFVGTVIS